MPASALRAVVETETLSVSQVCRVVFSPDGHQIAVAANQPNGFVLLDAATGVIVRRYPDPTAESKDFPIWLGFADQGAQIVEVTLKGTIEVWNTRSQTKIRTLETHASSFALAVRDDGRVLAMATEGGVVTLWDTQKGGKIRSLGGLGISSARALVFSQNGERIAVFSELTQDILVLDTASGKIVRRIKSGLDKVDALAFTADGFEIVAKAYGAIRLWSVANGTREGFATLAKLSPAVLRAFHEGANLFDTVSPDAKRFLLLSDPSAANGDAESLTLRDTATGAVLHRFKRASINPNPRIPVSTAFSPDGSRIAIATFDGALRLWNAASGALVYETGEIASNSYTVTALAYSADGQQVAVGRRGGAIVDVFGYTTLQL